MVVCLLCLLRASRKTGGRRQVRESKSFKTRVSDWGWEMRPASCQSPATLNQQATCMEICRIFPCVCEVARARAVHLLGVSQPLPGARLACLAGWQPSSLTDLHLLRPLPAPGWPLGSESMRCVGPSVDANQALPNL